MAALDQFEPLENGHQKPSWIDIETTLRQLGKDSRSFLIGILTILNSAGAICLAGTKKGRKDFPFEYATVVFLQECFKFSIAFACFSQESQYNSKVHQAGRNEFTWGIFLLFSIPALLYCFDNNFQYFILHFLAPAELTILWNFKIVMTAILMRVFLKQAQTTRQWFALGCLVLGCFLTQAHNLLRHPAALSVSEDDASRKVWGMILAFLGSTIMAGSNVFCEWLVKHKPQDSIHFQNMQLYFWGACINTVALLGKVLFQPESPIHEGFFTGYNGYTWCLLLTGAVSGIVVSFTLKFVDNIAVVFSHALAMVVVTTISALFFNFSVSIEFLLGTTVVASATVAYYVEEPEILLSKVKKGELGKLQGERSSKEMYCFNDAQ
eukprot:gnl/MRDRNA2_/MRDRNA2_79266_c0_seq3.p1 gnl/MRDRNA2_/MRDRNA2_79266_c0~~gnl/MRDRNA2_/MRDRNA2_79266_c0_seq3.p1  ORF type:complete len:380 (+),score=44.14 gnl/MRDRNA2_/MRDRNA2_79266_c0_seq3:88-1227(+)